MGPSVWRRVLTWAPDFTKKLKDSGEPFSCSSMRMRDAGPAWRNFLPEASSALAAAWVLAGEVERISLGLSYRAAALALVQKLKSQ